MHNKRTWTKFLAGVMALVLAFTLSAGITGSVSAKTSSQWQQEINSLEKEKKELQQQMDALQEDIDANFSEMEKITAMKNLIDQEVFLLNQQILAINTQISTYSSLIADKQEELDAAQANLEELSRQNRARIRAMEENGSISYWAVLFEANSFSDLLDRIAMIQEIEKADNMRMEQLRQASAQVEEARNSLEIERSKLAQTKVELSDKQKELDAKREEANVLLAELIAKGDEFDALMEEAEEEEEKLLADIAEAEKNRKDAYDKEQAAQLPPPGNNYGAGEAPGSNVVDGVEWVIPCTYSRVSSPYGWRIHPVYGVRKFHSGIDLAAPSGTPIYATRTGQVTLAVYSTTAGYYVTINHGDGFSSTYMHMTHYVVKTGQYVSAGQLIGYVGSTGTSTGPHLHFGIYYNGSSVNPANYIKF